MATICGFSAFVSISTFASNCYIGCAELNMCLLYEASFFVQINCNLICLCVSLLWLLLLTPIP